MLPADRPRAVLVADALARSPIWSDGDHCRRCIGREHTRTQPQQSAAVALLTAPTSPAHAEPKDPIPPVTCYSINSVTGVHQFHLPGETIIIAAKDGNLHTLECGEDGNWKDISRSDSGSRTRQLPPGAPVLSRQVAPVQGLIPGPTRVVAHGMP